MLAAIGATARFGWSGKREHCCHALTLPRARNEIISRRRPAPAGLVSGDRDRQFGSERFGDERFGDKRSAFSWGIGN